jgi:hypothetical protein
LSSNLTGAYKFHRGLFGGMYLMVEYKKSYSHDLGGTGYYDEGQYLVWRKAKWRDILYLQQKGFLNASV